MSALATKLSRWLSLPEPLDYRGVNHITERWAPYAGLVYSHLLLDSLTTSGWVAATPAAETDDGQAAVRDDTSDAVHP